MFSAEKGFDISSYYLYNLVLLLNGRFFGHPTSKYSDTVD